MLGPLGEGLQAQVALGPSQLTSAATCGARCSRGALAATSWKPSWGVPSKEPTIWLVSDEGVYLMSAADPGDNLATDGTTSLYTVMAQGIDPEVDAFDDWWERKREVFGGDDFADQFGKDWCQMILQDIDAGAKTIRIEVTEDSYRYLAPGR